MLDPARIKKLLIRSTNWIGDAVMTIPAITAIRQRFPEATITILAKEWVAEIFRISPAIDNIIILDDNGREGRHSGIAGKLLLSQELRAEKFDAAILLQNAISAAIITSLARIPVRAGYNTDGRGLLLTDSVPRRRGVKRLHQTRYYLEMVQSLGCPEVAADISLKLPAEYNLLARRFLAGHGISDDRKLIGIAPGAAYGPAKRWLPERFAQLASLLGKHFNARILLFGSADDRAITDSIAQATNADVLNLAGATKLREAMALMSQCSLFIANDSGLMHVAGALNLPLVAIFGSTNHITTAPLGARSLIVRHDIDCSPCLRKECHIDFRCMRSITVDDVFSSACDIVAR